MQNKSLKISKMETLILNKNLARSGKYKGDQQKMKGKLLLRGKGDTSIWELEKGKGFAVTRFSKEFPRIYKTLSGAKKSAMWQFHNN